MLSTLPTFPSGVRKIGSLPRVFTASVVGGLHFLYTVANKVPPGYKHRGCFTGRGWRGGNFLFYYLVKPPHLEWG